MNKLTVLAILANLALTASAKDYTLKSPSGNIGVTVSVDDSIHYSVARDGRIAVQSVGVGLKTADSDFGAKPSVKKVRRNSVSRTIKPVVPMKHSEIADKYNQLTLDFKGGYGLELRAYDNGVAHRLVTSLKADSVKVAHEKYNVTLADGAQAHLQMPGGFITSYEEPYTHKKLAEWTVADRMATLPALFELADGNVVLVSECDVEDYPHMFIKGDGKGGFSATYPRVPMRYGPNGDRSLKILEESPYTAHTVGKRAYPWRFMAVGTPATIIEQTFTTQLAQPRAFDDTSWIKPGFVSWEWWNGATPYGPDVDFEAGCNLETYKYFIDFAAKYGLEYILMDEGWAKSTLDPYTPNPDVDLMEIIRYGKEKGVGVFLWLTWLVTENNFDLFKQFKDWGVAGVKIDFMDRSDQWMVDFYERVCREAAKNGLMVDLHGSFKPAGLEHKYPNLLSYEGVRGMEQMGGCRPENTLYLPFMRNAVGPMDYTPGAMISTQPECYASERPNSASIGTRAYQTALFVIFESGIQMLADNPTLYMRNNECTEFLADIPQTWDETRLIDAKIGDYMAIAKRKGDKWYVGAITGDGSKWRTLDLPLDFLDKGRKYKATWIEDGINAPRQAMDYRMKNGTVGAGDTFKAKIARNGGLALIIEPAE